MEVNFRGCLSYCSVALIKQSGQGNFRRKSLFGLMVPVKLGSIMSKKQAAGVAAGAGIRPHVFNYEMEQKEQTRSRERLYYLKVNPQ